MIVPILTNTLLLKGCGKDVFISPQACIRRPEQVRLGDYVDVDHGVYMTTGALIGDYVHLAAYATIVGGEGAMLYMGNFTNLATGVRVLCGSDSFDGEGLIGSQHVPLNFRSSVRDTWVRIENFANVGAGAILFPGVIVREGCVIGAGAVVTRDTHPWTVYMGVPAKPIKHRPREKMLKYAELMGYPGGEKAS